MLDKHRSDEILAAVDAGFDARVAFALDLVRFPSLRGQEHSTQGFVIEAAFPIIAALRRLEESWNRQRADRSYFEDLDHPINFNAGKIAGGDGASSVPAWCSFDCRISIHPGRRGHSASRPVLLKPRLAQGAAGVFHPATRVLCRGHLKAESAESAGADSRSRRAVR